LFSFAESKAHGDISIRIIKKTSEILKNPKKPLLYFERGYLYQQHQEYKNAIKDYLKSEHLGLDNKLLHFRKAATYYKANTLNKALQESEICLTYDPNDIKTHKLKAQILFGLQNYNAAVLAYKYVIENTVDLKPEDYIIYSEYIVAIDHNNYKNAIAALDLGIENLGKKTIALQLKKIAYLKKTVEHKKVITLYNSLIQDSERKEFLYYEKARYLFEIKEHENANIALQQAKLTIKDLKLKYQNTKAVKNLKININTLEKKL
jgi:tetratricopeptide (TPR) repeat protein